MPSLTKDHDPPYRQAEVDFERLNWGKARKKFISNHKDNAELQLFLQSRMEGWQVKNTCMELQQESDNKYHSGFGSILANINALMDIGDIAIKSAPESVGLAWMGIRMCLHAVQGDWSTFQLFSGACADIVGIMISCRVYGKLYGENDGENSLEDFQELHAKIVDYIPGIYTDILEFSYAVRKYTDTNKVIRIGKNIFKDTRIKFEGIIDKIKASDEKMRDFAKTASEQMMNYLQKKTIKGQDEMKVEIISLKSILETSLKANEAVIRRAFEELEEEKKNMRKKTPYEKAQDEFEDNMTYLDPTPDQYEMLSENLDIKREPGTCQWILEDKEYKKWREADCSSLIWVSGAGGYGKSILMSTIIETLRAETTNSDKEVVQYFFCKAGSDTTQATTHILKTIVAQLYNHSLGSPDLLEQTNEIVSHGLSKQDVKNKLGSSFDFVTVYKGLLQLMNRVVFLVIDAVDECVDRVDKQLLKYLRKIVGISEVKVKIMICSRPETDIGNELSNFVNVKCEGRNIEDIRKNTLTEMNRFPRWTASEKADAVSQITHKSGGQFRYVQIALDFLRKPLVRPYSRVLDRLPDSLTGSYTASWNATDKDYVGLLKTALTWTLFADGPVAVPEIMDSYSRAYSDDAGVEAELEDSLPVEGEVDLHDRQIRIAGGNFLEVSSARTVSLRHLTVRDFFVNQDEMLVTDNGEDSGFTSSQQLKSLSGQEIVQRSPWTISAKEGHLEMTKILVQNLASRAFQEKYLSPYATERQIFDDTEQTAPPPAESKDSNTTLIPGKSVGDDIVTLRRICQEAENEENQVNIDEADANADVDGKEDEGEDEEEDDDSDQEEFHERADQDYAFSDFDDDEDLWDSKNGGFALYHSFKQVEEEDDDQDVDLKHRSRRDSERKIRYELTHWTYHLAEAQKLWSWEEQKSNACWKSIWQHLVKFMCEDVAAFESWQAIVFKKTDISAEKETSSAPSSRDSYHYGTPLQIAAIFDLTSLAKVLIERGHKATERKLFSLMHPSGNFSANSLTATYLTTTPLDLAVGKQRVNIDMVKICVENGCDVNDLTTWSPPFQVAVWHEPSYDFVKYLIDRGARADIEDGDDYYPLHRFSESGTDPRVFQLLLDAGADINVKADGESPLLMLVAREDLPLPLLQAYLDAGANVNDEDYQSQRPLVEPVRRSNYEAVKLLIDLGADVNDSDKQHRTAMHWVARSGNTQILDLLVTRGARINLPDKRGRTPLLYACQYNNEEVAKKLLEYLIDQPIDEVNKQDFRRRTPLRQAAAHGNVEVVRAILKIPGAALSINLGDNPGLGPGQNALHKAAHNGGKATLQVLLAEGGDLSLTDGRGLTPFDLCMRAWVNNRSISKLKSLEDTLLFLASQSKDPESKETTDLMCRAVMKGSTRIVQTLLDNGLSADIKDAYGWSPLMLAQQWHQYAMIEMLKSASNRASPSSWILFDNMIALSGNGLQARVFPDVKYNSLTIVSDQPIPATSRKYYFEIEVRALFGTSYVVVGLTSLPTKLKNGHLGRGSSGVKSCGWSGKEGRLFGRDSVSDIYPSFKSGDTIGCAIDLGQQTVFYTKNGERLETAFTGVVGRLHPALTAVFGKSDHGWVPLIALVRANFGGDLKNRPWKWEGWQLWHRAK